MQSVWELDLCPGAVFSIRKTFTDFHVNLAHRMFRENFSHITVPCKMTGIHFCKFSCYSWVPFSCLSIFCALLLTRLLLSSQYYSWIRYSNCSSEITSDEFIQR